MTRPEIPLRNVWRAEVQRWPEHHRTVFVLLLNSRRASKPEEDPDWAFVDCFRAYRQSMVDAGTPPGPERQEVPDQVAYQRKLRDILRNGGCIMPPRHGKSFALSQLRLVEPETGVRRWDASTTKGPTHD